MPTPVAKIPEPPTPRETMAAERKKGEQVFDVRRMTFAMGGGEKGQFYTLYNTLHLPTNPLEGKGENEPPTFLLSSPSSRSESAIIRGVY